MTDQVVMMFHSLLCIVQVKAKNSVLKQAVQDLTTKCQAAEQQASGKNAAQKHKVALRETEQQLRQSKQELDALKFHNQQLTKRVEVLQSEDSQRKGAGSSSKKKKNAAAAAEDALALQEEELRRQISNNEQLHRQIGEMQRDHDRSMCARVFSIPSRFCC